ncbi:MAG: hypothetical protein ACRDU9_01210 [Acidimicrobiia bacterium]
MDFPRLRDPRLHVAAVIITIHVLGQVGLGFEVSIPQVLAAILACALIEVGWTFANSRRIVWPASAMLTGSGVALIFRILGNESGDHWSFDGWHLFAIVAGASLITKYLIRFRGAPVFNPSNVGLVAAFLLLGSGRVEPLDFWWGPLNWSLALAYGVILIGGIAITYRLGLLPMTVVFWVTFVAGLGILAASSHCITARWAFEPVCDFRFFRVVSTSPEVLVFMFFMITDPRTIPVGRRARIWFGVAVAIVSILLIAPQTTEFGAKVGLLGGLVVMTGLRPPIDWLIERRALAASREVAERMEPRRPMLRWVGASVAVAVFIVGIVAAGAPARTPIGLAGDAPAPAIFVDIDPASLPEVTVDPKVVRLDASLDGDGAQDLALALANALATEAEALLRGDEALMSSVSMGARLNEMDYRLSQRRSGISVVPLYRFESMHLIVTHPDGPQGGADPAFEARGMVEQLTIDSSGQELKRTTVPFARAFSLRRSSQGKWLISGSHPLR